MNEQHTGHYSVLLHETVDAIKVKPDGIYLDCTLGGGGHSEEILKRLGNGTGKLYAVDRDAYAIERAGERLASFGEKVAFLRGNFVDAAELLAEKGVTQLDGVIADLGVSSFQLDQADRGFSYMQNATLDMRMSRGEGKSAFDVVNGYEERDLRRIIELYGEERFASRIAYFIGQARAKKPIESTIELAEIIKSAIPAKNRKDGPHPAKRTFQAIRIEVNGELDVIDTTIQNLFPLLAPGGRMAFISFHSLEDRIIKHCFLSFAEGCTCPREFPICICGNKPKASIITKKPILPSEEELALNPRSRSAKLRAMEKI